MINLKNNIVSIISILTLMLFTVSCGGSTSDNDHNDMMDEDNVEVMENNDHMNEDEHADSEHMEDGEHMDTEHMNDAEHMDEDHMHDSTQHMGDSEDHMHDAENEHPE